MTSRATLLKEFICHASDIADHFEVKSQYRIMTFNVHNFLDYKGVPNFDKIMLVVKNSLADIIGLNEAYFFRKGVKEKFLEAIKDLYPYCAIAHFKFGINILLSKFPILQTKVITLDCETKKDKRYALQCDIQIKEVSIKVALTHLDVWDESEIIRMQQITKIISTFDKCILMGDFNSLRFLDYTPQRLQKIKEDDLKRNVVSQSKVINYVESHNFLDSFFSCVKDPPTVTVWSGRRVDYIYIEKSVPIVVLDSNTFRTLESDHYPVYMDFIIA